MFLNIETQTYPFRLCSRSHALHVIICDVHCGKGQVFILIIGYFYLQPILELGRYIPSTNLFLLTKFNKICLNLVLQGQLFLMFTI